MIRVIINGRTPAQWFYTLIRNYFCRQEIKKGKIMVAWRDVDDMVYGWTLSADEEYDLVKVAQLITITKNKKLIHIINGKEEVSTNGKGKEES